MVEGVERFQPELQPCAMREVEVLEHCQVEVVDTRPALGVSSECPERPWRGLCEGRRIEPPRDRSFVDTWIAYQIGPVSAKGVVQPAEIGRRDRDRESLLPGVNAV